MAARDRIIVGLDIGTTKICCLITEMNESGELEVIGFGVSESKGLRRGLVVNMEQTVEAIRGCVEDAERMAYPGGRSHRHRGRPYPGISTSAVIAIKERRSRSTVAGREQAGFRQAGRGGDHPRAAPGVHGGRRLGHREPVGMAVRAWRPGSTSSQGRSRR